MNPPDIEWPKKYTILRYLKRDEESNYISVICNTFQEEFLLKSIRKKVDGVSPLEFIIFKDLNHPSISEVIDLFETPNYFNVVLKMPLMHLLDYLNSHKNFQEYTAKIIAYKIIQGLEFLHKNNICYGDISLESIIIMSEKQEKMNAALYDFSSSFLMDKQENIKKRNEIYSAPELLATDTKVDDKIDIYSLGVVLFIMLSGRNPFANMDQLRIAFTKTGEKFDYKRNEWKFISSEAVELLQAMLSASPEMRPTASQCLAFDWFSEYEDYQENEAFNEFETDLGNNSLNFVEMEDKCCDFDYEIDPINGMYF